MPDLPPPLPRHRRANSYFHVVLSGNRREALFSSPASRRALNKIAIDTLRCFGATLHAYCLLPNHFRILVQIDDRFLVKALRRITTRYSEHRRRELKTVDPIFERPYKAQRVETNGDFLNLLRAIHLSPVTTNRAVAPDDYRWSSHRAYLGYKSVAWITTDFGLSLLAADPAQARVAYHRFITEGIVADIGYTVAADEFQTVTEHSPTDHPQANTTDSPTFPVDLLLSGSLDKEKDARASGPFRFGRRRLRGHARRFLSIY